MLLAKLAQISKQVSATSRKKEKAFLIARLLQEARGKEIALAAQYLAGQLPQGRLGVGWKTLEEATRNPAPSPRSLDLTEVDIAFQAIAHESGSGSTGRKIRVLRGIFSRVQGCERDFLIRLIMGEIRQGALEGLVLEAVALACSTANELLRQAFMFSGNIGEVARAALEEGAAGLSRFGPKLFHPIAPMLASPVEGEDGAIARLGEVGWEFKVDGARIQVHKAGDLVRVFSRHLKEVTESIPEIVTLARTLPMEEAIFEGEAIALQENGKPFPFQVTMRRFGRIKDVAQVQKDIPLTPYFFDLLYLDGDPLFEIPYRKRIEELSQLIPAKKLIPHIITSDAERAREFFLMSLEAGHEGVMAKGLVSPYTAGQRGFSWLKIKPAHTLDLVVLAAEWGHGRRHGWLSNLHLGARDPETNSFVMLGKTFKGLTDEMLRWQTEKLLSLEIGRDTQTVYVTPELVVEAAFSDLQESQRYPGGLALRFARVKRFRKDKSPRETDTIQKVRDIFERSMRGFPKGGLVKP